MAKLHFKYGAMNCGKTTILIQTAYNYEEKGQKVIVIKPAVDTKGKNKIISRIGIERKVDALILPDDKILEKIKKYLKDLKCIIIDEAQFLTKEQAKELFNIKEIYNIPIIAFGLRSNFKGEPFEASEILLTLADSLEEIPTICRCGKKARFNARKVNGIFQTEGSEILIDGEDNKIEYEALCSSCFAKEVLKIKPIEPK